MNEKSPLAKKLLERKLQSIARATFAECKRKSDAFLYTVCIRELQAGFQLAHIINFYFYLYVCLFYMQFSISFECFLHLLFISMDSPTRKIIVCTALHCTWLWRKRTFFCAKEEKSEWKRKRKQKQVKALHHRARYTHAHDYDRTFANKSD